MFYFVERVGFHFVLRCKGSHCEYFQARVLLSEVGGGEGRNKEFLSPELKIELAQV